MEVVFLIDKGLSSKIIILAFKIKIIFTSSFTDIFTLKITIVFADVFAITKKSVINLLP